MSFKVPEWQIETKQFNNFPFAEYSSDGQRELTQKTRMANDLHLKAKNPRARFGGFEGGGMQMTPRW